MKITTSLLLCLLVGVIAKPNGSFDTNIIGGEDAKVGEFPYQVTLQLDGSHFCGGIILNKNSVLTTGGCLDGKQPDLIEVVAGANNITNPLEKTRQRVPASRTTLHEDFNRENILNDIGVVILSKPIEFDENVHPIEVCEELPATGLTVVTIGWGNAHPKGERPPIFPDILQKVSLQMYDHAKCQADFPGQIQPYMVCAKGGANSGACHGDGGGPLIFTEASTGKQCLTGIVSFGKDICGQEATIFTGPTYFKEWIAGAIES